MNEKIIEQNSNIRFKRIEKIFGIKSRDILEKIIVNNKQGRDEW